MSNNTTQPGDCACCRSNREEKPAWGPGPWQTEPERVQWEHAGLPCIAHRGPHGSWCAYVGVPPGHPSHGKDYDDVPVECHWGLTYAAACAGCICHVPKPGEPDDVWWLEMDFAHAGDLCPGVEARLPGYLRMPRDDHYWTLAEVQAETESLAKQLAALSG